MITFPFLNRLLHSPVQLVIFHLVTFIWVLIILHQNFLQSCKTSQDSVYNQAHQPVFICFTLILVLTLLEPSVHLLQSGTVSLTLLCLLGILRNSFYFSPLDPCFWDPILPFSWLMPTFGETGPLVVSWERFHERYMFKLLSNVILV